MSNQRVEIKVFSSGDISTMPDVAVEHSLRVPQWLAKCGAYDTSDISYSREVMLNKIKEENERKKQEDLEVTSFKLKMNSNHQEPIFLKPIVKEDTSITKTKLDPVVSIKPKKKRKLSNENKAQLSESASEMRSDVLPEDRGDIESTTAPSDINDLNENLSTEKSVITNILHAYDSDDDV
jgi:hypothetical protein